MTDPLDDGRALEFTKFELELIQSFRKTELPLGLIERLHGMPEEQGAAKPGRHNSPAGSLPDPARRPNELAQNGLAVTSQSDTVSPSKHISTPPKVLKPFPGVEGFLAAAALILVLFSTFYFQLPVPQEFALSKQVRLNAIEAKRLVQKLRRDTQNVTQLIRDLDQSSELAVLARTSRGRFGPDLSDRVASSLLYSADMMQRMAPDCREAVVSEYQSVVSRYSGTKWADLATQRIRGLNKP